MAKYQSIHVSFVPKPTLAQWSTKVAPIHNHQHTAYIHSFSNSKKISATSNDLFEKSEISEDHNQYNQPLSDSTLSSHRDHSLNSPAKEKKKGCYKVLIISLGIIFVLLASIAMACSLYLLIEGKTTASTTRTTTTTTTASTTTSTTTTTTTSTTSTTTTTPFCTPILYTGTFTSGIYSSPLCSAWTSFLASLTCSNYTSLTISGTYDTNGIIATNQVIVNAIATALRTSATYTGISNGITWSVGICGAGTELTTTSSICQCTTGYTIRPCIGSYQWGGVATTSCSAVSQVMTVSFE